MLKNYGFIFIETIIVICVLTVGLMSLYANYSKILTNTRELNTFDTAEYNYKTYFLMKKNSGLTDDNCLEHSDDNDFSPEDTLKICKLKDITNGGSKEVKDYINDKKSIMDAYIIDYLLAQDLHVNNDNLFLVEYKKEDKQNPGEYFTYISSLNY